MKKKNNSVGYLKIIISNKHNNEVDTQINT